MTLDSLKAIEAQSSEGNLKSSEVLSHCISRFLNIEQNVTLIFLYYEGGSWNQLKCQNSRVTLRESVIFAKDSEYDVFIDLHYNL